MTNALLTDQYTLTMGQSFWQNGQAEDICNFDLFVRRLPRNRAYLVAAGLDEVLDFVENWHFSEEDIEFLAELGYQPGYLEYLKQLKFTGNIRAVKEGTLLPAQAPLLTVEAPRIQASIMETALLTIINHQTMVASKTSRITNVAGDADVWDFSLRRLHGLGAGLGVARAAYLAGATGTATVEAGKRYGIPTAGTMAHHFVQSFGQEKEQQAFQQFLRDYPQKNTLLVDTYDTLRGIERAIAAAEAEGVKLGGVRLDSGDLLQLSLAGRDILDQHGYTETKIFASNDLDEYKIAELQQAGAAIDHYGVGTMLGTSADAPNLGGVFKLTEQLAPGKPQYVIKLAAEKTTDPGQHQLWRDANRPLLLAMRDERPSKTAEPLLETVVKAGKVIKRVQLADARKHYLQEIAALAPQLKDIHSTQELRLERSPQLMELRNKMMRTTAPVSV